MVEQTNGLDEWRREIDATDREIMELLCKRFEITTKIRRYKKTNNLPVMDKKREEDVVMARIADSGLPRQFIKDLYKIIFEESRRVQR